MDLDWNDDQRAILDALRVLLDQHAGQERAAELARDDAYDTALHAALADAGYLEISLADDAGLLEAAMLVDAVAGAAGSVSIGASALIAPALVGAVPPDPVALARAGERGPVRFGAHAAQVLVDDGDEARLVELGDRRGEPVETNYALPMGRLPDPLPAGRSLGAGSSARLRRLWRLALAAECHGAMRAAMDLTARYVSERRQFGRAIGSFQAIQHRFAECEVRVQGGRWLMLEAAHQGAPAGAVELAAGYATRTALQVFNELHQFTGAMGFTREHPLHTWTLRLQLLRLELGGPGMHYRQAARVRWGRAARGGTR